MGAPQMPELPSATKGISLEASSKIRSTVPRLKGEPGKSASDQSRSPPRGRLSEGAGREDSVDEDAVTGLPSASRRSSSSKSSIDEKSRATNSASRRSRKRSCVFSRVSAAKAVRSASRRRSSSRRDSSRRIRTASRRRSCSRRDSSILARRRSRFFSSRSYFKSETKRS